MGPPPSPIGAGRLDLNGRFGCGYPVMRGRVPARNPREARVTDATIHRHSEPVTMLGRLAKAARAVLPRGGSLPEESWRIRHRAILALLWLHAIGIAAFGVVAGYG